MNEKEITKQFEFSAHMITKLNKGITNDELLKLYGLYKQGNLGDCNIAEPSKIFNYKENAKWHAWKKFKGTKKIDAMIKYSDFVLELIDKYGVNI